MYSKFIVLKSVQNDCPFGKAPCKQKKVLDSFYWKMLRKLIIKAFICIKLQITLVNWFTFRRKIFFLVLISTSQTKK